MTPLVIGYGNTLRRDDGVGRYVAETLIAEARIPDADIRSVHQLTPELALDISGASVVIFIDATFDLAAGGHDVQPVTRPAAPSSWSHLVAPDALGDLAQRLYGRAPDMVSVRVGIADAEPGEGLTPAVEAAVPAIADTVAALAAAARPGTLARA